ncbi:baeRF12 domain-containing protein [Falsigemmobacter faecalis]|uniref:Host cell attachment protein n=1 Tax=Falsigemmobacter faecalis TaxID=2488730 RepID=A0A3P3DS38_9RHOB|nr:host attachment protein [Falsigemmobacter faecalis]RRH75488.1 host cell attachment protein [Falsigemmobacter faecalis]
MDVPRNTVVAVVDGETFNLFKVGGEPGDLRLSPMRPHESEDRNSASGRSSSAANPAAKQMEEDAFGKGVVDKLNTMVLEGRIGSLLIIAAPRSLGEMRRSYHSKLQEVLVGEIDKVLTGASTVEIEKAISAA